MAEEESEGKKYASQKDFEVLRDEEDNIIPVDVELEDSDKWVKVKPITYGKANKEFKFDDPNDVPTSKLVTLIKDHIVKPDYGWIDEHYVNKKMKPLAVGELIKAIMNASGLNAKVDYDGEGPAKIEFDEEDKKK